MPLPFARPGDDRGLHEISHASKLPLGHQGEGDKLTNMTGLGSTAGQAVAILIAISLVDASLAAEPPATGTATGSASSAPNPNDDEEDEPERPTYVYGGIGFAAFGLHPIDRSLPSHDELGLALALGGRHAVHDHVALGMSLTWGLTTWSRTEALWRAARSVGRWTKNAYIDVTDWVREGNEDDKTLRGLAAFFAYFGLLFPYALSGIMYVMGPVWATSHFEFNFAGTFHVFETKKGPYLETGLSILAYVHPSENEMRAAVGPSFGMGYDFGHLGFGARGTFSPRFLHSEVGTDRTDIYTGQLILKVQ